ncbi:7-carboxy-7-deazaguanine synthase QueE [Streptomyces zingiberis]|uniref:7-carboxy-7-deazaguanine synthase QueE n=1 Tax=Streptomyces zingiberis TaxID=2053010 RepID=UPI001F0EC218|nr:7-carboxy-7-deazaguanine synthase QueE [Streptomyces zingiberis]
MRAVQGEGPSLGRCCAFVRLGGCNLGCTWCDTPYTWDWTGSSDSGKAWDPRAELHAMPWQEVARRLRAFAVPLIVVSGGEPLNQQRRLVPLLRDLTGSGHQVEIETNGTVVPAPEVTAMVRFNVSPKLAHSGEPEARRIVPEALSALAAVPGTAFKFVCRGPEDLDEVTTVTAHLGRSPVWIMPVARSRQELDRNLASLGDAVVARGWNLTTRLHISIWGDRRGT